METGGGGETAAAQVPFEAMTEEEQLAWALRMSMEEGMRISLWVRTEATLSSTPELIPASENFDVSQGHHAIHLPRFLNLLYQNKRRSIGAEH